MLLLYTSCFRFHTACRCIELLPPLILVEGKGDSRISDFLPGFSIYHNLNIIFRATANCLSAIFDHCIRFCHLPFRESKYLPFIYCKNIIMGVGEDEELGDAIAVTIVATGFAADQQRP